MIVIYPDGEHACRASRGALTFWGDQRGARRGLPGFNYGLAAATLLGSRISETGEARLCPEISEEEKLKYCY